MRLKRVAQRVVRKVASLGRVALALVLLALLWFGTVKGVDRGSREADERRAADRQAVAVGFASSVQEWLTAGRTEAASLARTVGGVPGPGSQPAIDAFISQPRGFTRSAIVMVGSRVVASSARRASLVGLSPKACSRTGEGGDVLTDDGLSALVARAPVASEPVVSGFFDIPGDCHPGVAIASRSGAGVTVVFGTTEDIAARVIAGSLIGDPVGEGGAGTRVLIVTGHVALDPEAGLLAAPQRLASLTEQAARAREPKRGRYTIGEGDAEVVAAVAPIADGWAVALEQDAAIFDIELQNRPSVVVASILTVVFAVVFALLAIFDSRRRKAHTRTETAKNAFFSIAGHELRTPLTSLKGFAEMLSTNWSQLNNEKRRTLVERMAPQARRLDRLVERLLVAASIQAETHIRPQMTELDPVETMQTVAEHFRIEAPLHTFVVEPGAEHIAVLADGRALDQVLQHLVENAVKYSPSGGNVWLTVGRRGRGVEIAVEDEGVGLPSDHRAIFDKFTQGESVTKRVHDEGGVGLGLYIVRTLVEDMGGTVRAEPAGAGGARFIVTLRGPRPQIPSRHHPNGLVHPDGSYVTPGR